MNICFQITRSLNHVPKECFKRLNLRTKPDFKNNNLTKILKLLKICEKAACKSMKRWESRFDKSNLEYGSLDEQSSISC